MRGMDIKTAHTLNEVTARFYAQEAGSFSSTRQAPWEGWRRLLGLMPSAPAQLAVLDVGCGNLRFERFLNAELPDTQIVVDALDNCPALAEASASLSATVRFRDADVMAALERDELAPPLGASGEHDLAVSFGLMHHVPLASWRSALMRALVRSCAPGGLVAVSFWQFMKSERLARQAHAATERGQAELGIRLASDAGDWLLGWQGKPGVYRYCHSFDDDEIASLAQTAALAGARLITRYEADGPSSDLNGYVVLQRDID